MAIQVRQALASDARAVARIYEPYVLNTPITFEEIAPTIEEIRERIVSTLTRFPYLVAEEHGQVLGYAYAGAHRTRASYRWAVDVAIYLAEGHHRKGIGTRLYRELIGHLEQQGFTRAYAGITLPNESSVGLHESLSFTRIGVYQKVGYKLGAWRDVGWWERLLVAATDQTPREPIPWPMMPSYVEP